MGPPALPQGLGQGLGQDQDLIGLYWRGSFKRIGLPSIWRADPFVCLGRAFLEPFFAGGV